MNRPLRRCTFLLRPQAVLGAHADRRSLEPYHRQGQGQGRRHRRPARSRTARARRRPHALRRPPGVMWGSRPACCRWSHAIPSALRVRQIGVAHVNAPVLVRRRPRGKPSSARISDTGSGSRQPSQTQCLPFARAEAVRRRGRTAAAIGPEIDASGSGAELPIA
jgi:hypothetical protein